MDIGAIISGDQAAVLHLEQIPDVVHRRLLAPITSLTARLLAAVRAREPKRTGRLVNETKMRITEAGDVVRGQVFVAASGPNEHGKAGALEYGARRRVSVSGYQRSGHTPTGAPAEQIVAAYTRQANIIARHYERGPLDEMRPEIVRELDEAMLGL